MIPDGPSWFWIFNFSRKRTKRKMRIWNLDFFIRMRDIGVNLPVHLLDNRFERFMYKCRLKWFCVRVCWNDSTKFSIINFRIKFLPEIYISFYVSYPIYNITNYVVERFFRITCCHLKFHRTISWQNSYIKFHYRFTNKIILYYIKLFTY